jgi:hypothetical protein
MLCRFFFYVPTFYFENFANCSIHVSFTAFLNAVLTAPM